MHFKTPVPVKAANSQTHNVKSAAEAAEVMRSWGKVRRVYMESYPVVVAAIEGKATPEEARDAFEAAAREAGVLRGG